MQQVYNDGTSTETTLYFFGGAYEVKNPGLNQTVTKYYAIAGITVAMNDGTNLVYFLTDHLGSIVAVLDDAGSILSEQRYLPFGKVREDVGPAAQTDFGYTFQRNLPEMGLMDYKARFYDPTIGRFVQPDNIVPITFSSQGWNRYAYTNNNPINFTDPSGHCFTGLVADTIFCIFVASLIVGAITGGVISAVTQENNTGHIDPNKVFSDAWGGAVIGGAPAIAALAAPEIVGGVGYGLYSAGQSLGSTGIAPKVANGLTTLGTNTTAASISINQFLYSPFPVPVSQMSSFSQGNASPFQGESDNTFYRLSSENSSKKNWWVINPPSSEVQWRIDQAVDPKWGNNASTISILQVPEGKSISGWIGSAAYQGGYYIGGGKQIYFPYVPSKWITKVLFLEFLTGQN